jgi:hypothetical protein
VVLRRAGRAGVPALALIAAAGPGKPPAAPAGRAVPADAAAAPAAAPTMGDAGRPMCDQPWFDDARDAEDVGLVVRPLARRRGVAPGEPPFVLPEWWPGDAASTLDGQLAVVVKAVRAGPAGPAPGDTVTLVAWDHDPACEPIPFRSEAPRLAPGVEVFVRGRPRRDRSVLDVRDAWRAAYPAPYDHRARGADALTPGQFAGFWAALPLRPTDGTSPGLAPSSPTPAPDPLADLRAWAAASTARANRYPADASVRRLVGGAEHAGN